MPNGLMSQAMQGPKGEANESAPASAATPMTSAQQQLVQEMKGIGRQLSATAADATLPPEKKRDLITRGLIDYRVKRGELAADLFESHALALGTSPQRIELIQGVRALRDSLQRVARDPRLTAEQRRTIINSHADYLRQRLKELRSPDAPPQGALGALKDIPAQIRGRLDELSASLQQLPAFARQQLDEWTRPQKTVSNPRAADTTATEAVEPFLF